MVTIRPFQDDDHELAYRVARLAFGGPPRPTGIPVDPPGAWHGLVAEDGGAIEGFLRVWRYNQFFGGRAVPTGGVASVAVSPHVRRRGIAGRMLAEALQVMREEGQCVSALYPYVVPVYRARGWELVGTRREAVVPLSELAAVADTDVPLRQATATDLDSLHACYLRTASRIDGMFDRAAPAFDVSRVLELDVVTVAPGESGLRGYLSANRPDGKRLQVYDLAADDVDTARALLRGIASWAGALADASVRILDGALLELIFPMRLSYTTEAFMLRVVDLPAAVAARGWPAVAFARPFRVDIEVIDPWAPWQAGRWRLAVEDGVVTCEPGGAGEVTLHAGALGPWFAGSTTTDSLRQVGLLTGDPAAAAALDALTGAPHPVHLAEAF
ncbi:GNAT family N-acetyltransferase [Actinokineospora enzanensis]|uniref:GNAT family N-acetyltransferase n=1 Tax=Actinokineospora enzanensis TaxID=155975 RepID=UPI00037AE10C|nr:GNAT family N-acetyltransferase [Actinokineospora enzanensis]